MWDQSFSTTNVNFQELDHYTMVETTTDSVGLSMFVEMDAINCPFSVFVYFSLAELLRLFDK